MPLKAKGQERHHLPATGSHAGLPKPRPLTTESLSTGADIATGHVLASAAIRAWVGFTLVVIDVTVCTTPAWITVTLVALL